MTHDVVAQLIAACAAARTVRLGYQDRAMDVDPWAVVLRHSRWYLLAWSRTREAVRALRVDRITAIESTHGTFDPPPGLDALRTLEEHLSQHWTHSVEVVFDAPVDEVARRLPRSLGRLAADGDRTRLRATTDNPRWYARQLAAQPYPFQVVASPEIAAALLALGERLVSAGEAGGLG